ncbi:MAG: hypothetical protein LBR93_01810 [Treponema sp.]|jgi:hypothetical protein|nr:hypothetical protein [Treponema sp.]
MYEDRDLKKAVKEEDVVPGLSSADVADMMEKVFSWTDGNHPQLNISENGFLDILRNGKPDMSASLAFIKKAAL